MTSGFGAGNDRVTTPEQRELADISQQPGPDVNTDFVKLVQKHDYEIQFLASQMKQTQQGVQEANQNPIQQIQQFIADIVVLLGGGELPKGALDFGDFKYMLQALGALFGFGADGTYPINLFAAAEKMFFGYVIPGAQYADLVDNGIKSWGAALGFDPEFIKDVVALNDSMNDFATAIGNVLVSVGQFFQDLFTPTGTLGPIGELLRPIMHFLLKGVDLTRIGADLKWLTEILDPVVKWLTRQVNTWTQILDLLAGGISYLDGDVAGFIRDQVLAADAAVVEMLEWVASWFGLKLPQATVGATEHCPVMSGSTTDWQVGTDPATEWVFDATQSYNGGPGSFYTTGNGTFKRMLNQTRIPVFPGQPLVIRDWFQWSGIPVGANAGACVVFFNNSTEVSNYYLPIPATGDATEWTLITEPSIGADKGTQKLFNATGQRAGKFVAPHGVDNMRVGVYVDTTVTSGTVRVGAMSLKNWTFVTQEWVLGVKTWVTSLPVWLSDLVFGAPGQFKGVVPTGLEFLANTLINWLTGADTGTGPFAVLGQRVESFIHEMLWPADRPAAPAEWLTDNITTVMTAWRDYVTSAVAQFVDWVIDTFFSTWIDLPTTHTPRQDIHQFVGVFFNILTPQAWVDAIGGVADFTGWLIETLTGQMQAFIDALVDWIAATFFPWLPAAQITNLHTVIHLFFDLLNPAAWVNAVTAATNFTGWLIGLLSGQMQTFVDDLVDWVCSVFIPWLPAAQINDLHKLIHLFFDMLSATAWTDGITAADDLTTYITGQLTNQMSAFFDGLVAFISKWLSNVLDWASYPILHLFGKNPTPTVGGVVWTATQSLLQFMRGNYPGQASTPSATFISIGSGLVAGLSPFFNNVWKLLCASWDYLLGGSFYNGVAVAPFSPEAGANWGAAWSAVWGSVAPSGSTAPSSAAATLWGNVATGAFNGIFPQLAGGLLTQAIIGPSGWLQDGITAANDAANNAATQADVANAAALNAHNEAIIANQAADNAAAEAVIANDAANNAATQAANANTAAGNAHTAANAAQAAANTANAATTVLDGRITVAETDIGTLGTEIDDANIALDNMHTAIVAAYGGPPSSHADTVDTSYSDLINAGKDLQSIAQAGQTLGMNASGVLAVRDNSPMDAGLDPTAIVPYPLQMFGSQSANVVVTPGKWQAVFERAHQDAEFNSVSWIGHGIVTGFWFALLHMDSHGNVVTLFESPNLWGATPALMNESASGDNWNVYDLGVTVTRKASEVYGFAIRVDGAAGDAYEIVGQSCWLPDHPRVVPRTPGMQFDLASAVHSYAEDAATSSTLAGFTATASTRVVAAGPDRLLLSTPGAAAGSVASVSLDDTGAVTSVVPIALVDTTDNLIEAFADDYGNLYEVMATAARTAYRVTPDHLVAQMSAAASDPTGVTFPSTTLYPSDTLYPTAPKSRDNFTVGATATTPDGTVLVYNNDDAQLLALDFNVSAVTSYQFDATVNSVAAMAVNADASAVLMLNTATSEIVSTAPGNHYAATYLTIACPSGWSPIGLTCGDDTAHAYVLLDNGAGLQVMAVADLASGAVEFASATPATPPATAADVLVAGSAVATVNGSDVAAIDGAGLVVHKNVHGYDYAAGSLTSRQPLPWFSLSMYTGGVPVPAYAAAVTHPDVLVMLSADHVAVPSWVNTVFLIGVGGGGGGGGDITDLTMEGFGGFGGQIIVQVCYRGLQFGAGANVWASIGAGGNGGVPGSATGGDGLPGGAGAATHINIGSTLDALIAPGGLGGDGATQTHYALRNVPSTQPQPDPRLMSWGHAAGENNKFLISNGVWVLDTSPQPIAVAGQSLMVAGAVLRAAGGSPGGGGSGGLHVPGSTGYGWPGGSGLAAAVFSERIIYSAS